MCGIAGIVRKTGVGSALAESALRLQSALHHRGPDGVGAHRDSNRVFMNLRLAIVDRAGGDQPIWSEDRRVGIVYNGEVYNYRELRAELEGRNVRFHTNSDTEVVLRMYETYGVDSFERLSGMFGFCIWDDRSGEVFLVRDHLGIKPLYLYEDAEKFVFSSEIRGILSQPEVDTELDPAGFQDYLTFRYIQSPVSLFKRIRRLDAGTYIRIRGGQAVQYRYWEPEYKEPLRDPSPEHALEELAALFKRAVSSQLMGEVPIGVLLSGGLDSSAIAYFVHELGANLTTFNIGFPEVNEFQYSRAVAKAFGLAHIEVEMSVDELVARSQDVIMALDEPIADPACFPLHRLCDELQRQVTVVLSGEGGDELFGGYPQYKQLLGSDVDPRAQFTEFLDRSWYFRDGSSFLRDEHFPPHELRHRKYFSGKRLLNGMLNFDVKTWLPDNLMMKADKILMSKSLEGRFPFLDKDLFAFAAGLPDHFKISPEGTSKWLLKRLMEPKLPQEVTHRPKMGFTVPVDVLLQRLQSTVEDAAHASTPLSDVLKVDKLQNVVQDYYRRGHGSALRVWTIFVLTQWFNVAFRRYREDAATPTASLMRTSEVSLTEAEATAA